MGRIALACAATGPSIGKTFSAEEKLTLKSLSAKRTDLAYPGVGMVNGSG